MKKYVVVDLEMCRVTKNNIDLCNLNNEVIQIGAVLLDEKYRIVEEFMTYVSPEYGEVDQYINNLTGISNKDLVNAPCFKEAFENFISWIPSDATLVSWSENDELQIREELKAKDINIYDIDIYLDNWEDCQIEFSEKINSNKNYKLSEALRISDIDLDLNEHDGLVDARNTAKLFSKMRTESKFKLNEYYVSSEDIKRSLYNPFAELLKNYCFEG